MATKKVYIDEIGECTMSISRRSSRIRITIRPFDGIRVNIPHGLTFDRGIQFVLDKKKWILKTREKFAAIENEKTVFLPGVPFQTKFHTLEMYPVKHAKLRAHVHKKKIVVTYPQSADPKDKQIQEFVEQAIIEALRVESKAVLPGRVAELAGQHGFTYNNLYFKKLKSRWGSCSAKDNINLNLHLMRLPDYLIDYVILHELSHTIHKNHGEHFWELLNRVTKGKARQLQSELKTFNVHF